MSNVIEQSTRSTFGLDLTAGSAVQTYNMTITTTTPFGPISVSQQVIDGTDGADSIQPNSSTYYIFGFGGNDTLYQYSSGGTIAPVILVGGNGADTYVFKKHTHNLTFTGHVLDFSTSDGDKIDLTSTGLSFADLTITHSNANYATITGTGVFLSIAGDNVTLSASNVLTGAGGEDTTTGGDDDDGFDTGIGDDDVIGSILADIILAYAGNDSVLGGAGDDSLNGNQGDDTLLGGDDNDTLRGGKDDDSLNGNQGGDDLNGNDGDDRVSGGKGSDTNVRGGKNDDLVNGNNDDDSVYGDLGNDTLHGGKDDDLVSGGTGDDSLFGDLGDDILTGGEDADFFVFGANHDDDTVTDFVSGSDILHFSAALFANAQAVVDAFLNGVITTEDGTVTLEGVVSLTINDVEIF